MNDELMERLMNELPQQAIGFFTRPSIPQRGTHCLTTSEQNRAQPTGKTGGSTLG